ncbi:MULTISPECIES: DUF2815 family protein [Pectinatus]|uniref:DUF2815 family protein n=2 Tax=Selenomonadaceae TaxID=1843491 RepID=UPI0018C5B3D4|nr:MULTISPECIES: DUF2815 family protein [Pectinatus]
MKETSKTRTVLQNVRLSYAHIWEPAEDLNGNLKYSVSLIIPKDDKANLARIKKAIEAAKIEGKSKLANKKGVIPSNIDLPVRDGDVDRADDENYAGCYYLNAKAYPDHAPKIVDHKCEPVMDQSEVYSGCYAHVSVNFFAYNKNGNSGVSVGLGNIMKYKDGEPLSGGASAEEDFADLISDEDESADNFLN